jgi:hypothetical protein
LGLPLFFSVYLVERFLNKNLHQFEEFVEKEFRDSGPLESSFFLLSKDDKIKKEHLSPLVLNILQNHPDYELIQSEPEFINFMSDLIRIMHNRDYLLPQRS